MNWGAVGAWLLTEAKEWAPRDSDGRLAFSKEWVRIVAILFWVLTPIRMLGVKFAADALPAGITLELSVHWGWFAMIAFVLTGLVGRLDNAQRAREVARNGTGGTTPPGPTGP